MNYVKNMEIMTASIVLWEILALAALTTTCGMIHVHPMWNDTCTSKGACGDPANKWGEKRTRREGKAAKNRQVIVTWYKPEKGLPPEGVRVVVTFSGRTEDAIYSHTIGIARRDGEYECVEPTWQIDGLSVDDTVRMHIEAWADLTPYEERN